MTMDPMLRHCNCILLILSKLVVLLYLLTAIVAVEEDKADGN
jgi:hypothetical protein